MVEIKKFEMKVVFSFAVFLTFLFLVSCTKDYYQPPDTMPQNVSFSGDVIPIFNANCVSCHNDGGISPNLTADKAYGELTAGTDLVKSGNPDDSELYHRIMGQGSVMPPAGMMNHSNIDLIYVWIKEGALNNRYFNNDEK